MMASSRPTASNAASIVGHGREADPLREDAFLEQAIGELHGQRPLADDDWCDGCLGMAGVEPEPLQARLEEPRVVPEALDELGLGLEHLDGCQARGGDSRRR